MRNMHYFANPNVLKNAIQKYVLVQMVTYEQMLQLKNTRSW